MSGHNYHHMCGCATCCRAEVWAMRREEEIESMTDEAMTARRIAEELDELSGASDFNDDGNTLFAADMSAVLCASDAAFDAEAASYFHKLRARVREVVKAAMADEYDRQREAA